MKRILSVILTLALLGSLLVVPAFAADKTVTLREDWRLTSDLDLKVPEGDTLTINGNGYHIYEMGGKLTNSGGGTVTFAEGTILYPAAGDTDAARFTPNGSWDTEESNALMALRTGGYYGVKIDPSITHGTVTVDKLVFMKGEMVTLTATPDAGYYMAEYEGEDDGGFTIQSTHSVGGQAIKSFGANEDVTINVTFEQTPVVDPTLSPGGGTYTSAQRVTISCATAGAVICYTTDGSDPTERSTQYTAPITISETTTLKAVAFSADAVSSDVTTATYTITPGGGSGGGGGSSGSGSGSSSGSSSTTTETTKNPDGSTTTTVTDKTTGTVTETTTNTDGSTTTTVTDKITGTVTETTKNPDGSQEVMETKKDGTVTTTTTDTDGSKTEKVEQPDGTVTTTTTDTAGNKTETVQNTDGSNKTTVDNKDGSGSVTAVEENGQVVSQATLSEAAVAAALQAGEPVALPMPEVSVTTDRDNAPLVTVDLPAGRSAQVEIPVANVTPGTVAILVKEDGAEEVIKTSLTTENGVAVTLSDGDTVKLVDNSKGFDDVPDNYWGADAVAFATSRELFSGTGDTTFAPDTAMTRAMVVTVLARLEGVDTTAGATWYEAGAAWAVENGVSDGANMDQPLTREQLATMLWRYAGKPIFSTAMDGFPDHQDISLWAADAMSWAVGKGIIQGDGAGRVSPQGAASRAEVAAILMRFLQANQ